MPGQSSGSTIIFTPEQIAPCGMNCGVCSAYLAHSHNIPKVRGKIWHCSGCRARPKNCSYIKGQCRLLSKGLISFCYECQEFPCEQLRKIDQRYRTSYGVSLIGNLREVRDTGLLHFLKRQTAQFRCRECRKDAVSVHNRKCYRCDRITNLRTPPAKSHHKTADAEIQTRFER